MEWIITITIIAVGLVATGFSAWKSSRPRKDSLKPKWISWPLVTIVAGAVMLLAFVHAVNMMGITTGNGRPPI